MAYAVELKPSAARELAKLPRHVQRRIAARIDALSDDPRPGVQTVEGEKGLLRIRVGDYRIIYTVRDEILLVLVVRIRHRREVYRRL